MNTNFKLIDGHSNLYSISEDGIVINNNTNRIVKTFISANGYNRIELNGGYCKKYFIHRLVATTFIGKINKGLQVNHKDGNKLNNNYTNLEIVTPSENILHSFYLGMSKVKKGEECNFSKLTLIQVKEIINLNLSTSEIAELYNVSTRQVQRIKNGTRWSHIN